MTIAGTGKTYLTSKVIDDIQTALKSNPNHEGFAFFYCKRNEEHKRQEPLWILRSFVRQLSTIASDKNSMQTHVQEFYFKTRQESSEPSMRDCKELLLAFINLYPKTTFILDALDECDAYKRGELIEIFDYFVENASRPVKIFISSRPDGDIKERFNSSANISIQATDNHSDISRFVENEITKHRRWRMMSVNLRNDIIYTLQKDSEGM